MKVLIVGGVFGAPETYRQGINPTPEMTLAAGLRRRGVQVVTAGHAWTHSLAGIDVVHVHHLAKSVPGLAGGRLVRRAPVVFTRHNEERTLPARRAVALWLVNRTADAFVALSHQEAARLRSEVRGKVVVIRNGIEGPDRVPMPAQTRPDGPWRLLFAGQLIPRKGLDVLFHALASVRNHMDVSVRLVFHNAEQLDRLRALSGRLALTDQVIFVGRKDADGMAEEYRWADALVLPSLAEAESLPSVITEALLAGKPVVASNDAGIPEQVEDAGVLATPGHVGSLASALRRLASEYPVYRQTALRRRSEIRRDYAVDTMIERHLELYESVLSGRSGTVAPPARVAGS